MLSARVVHAVNDDRVETSLFPRMRRPIGPLRRRNPIRNEADFFAQGDKFSQWEYAVLHTPQIIFLFALMVGIRIERESRRADGIRQHG